MENSFKRLLSLVMVVLMVVSMVPTTVFAAETKEAEVNSVQYDTVAEAVQNATAGQTVTLLTDVERLPAIDRVITIDGDGHTVSTAFGEGQFGTVNGTVTIKNVVFANGNESIRTDYLSHDYTNLDLVIEGCTFNNLTSYAIMGGKADPDNHLLKSLTVTGCTFNTTEQNTNYMVYAQCVGTLNISGCTFNGGDVTKGAIHTGDSTAQATVATISGNQINGVGRGVQIGNRVEGSQITLDGNTFTSVTTAADSKSGAIYIHGNADENVAVSVTDNKINSCTSALYNNGNTAEGDSIVEIITTFTGNTVDGKNVVMDAEGNVVEDSTTPAVSEIDLSKGSYTITEPGEYTVIQSDASNYTNNTLTIKADATVTLTELYVWAAAESSAISIEGCDAKLIVSGFNTLYGGDNGAGIYVAEDASVTITSATGTGDDWLEAVGNVWKRDGGNVAAINNDDSGAAGIGGTWTNGNSGAITIDNVCVTAIGTGVHGSGIGSGSGKVIGEIVIKDSYVLAQGGYYVEGGPLQSDYGKSDPEGGAAIGGGGKTASTVAAITITDSAVDAYGGSKAAGIGANFWSSVSDITISGDSEVYAYGGSSSAGIGTSRAGDTGVSANITISGGTVNAIGGAYGAGIGAGYNADSLGNKAEVSALPETSITISGGNVTATGGEGGAGIGGGYKSDNVNIDITGGTVTATAGALVSGKTVEKGGAAAAIGSGANGSGVFENSPAAEISDAATVTVTAYEDGKAAVEGVANTALGTNVTLKEIPNPATPAISGTITDCQIDMSDPAETFITSEIMNLNATKSVVIKLYSGGTHIATTTLQKSKYFQMNTLGVKIIITGEPGTWYTEWEEGKLSPEYVPDRVVLFVDDKEMSSAKVPMIKTNGEQAVNWADVPGVAAVGLKGEGTEKNPYLIENLDDLIWFRDNVNTYTSDRSNQYVGKYVKLTADIDLEGINWTPIGTNSVGDHAAFMGIFDGDGHTISNLYINADGDHLGFFARTGSYYEAEKAVIKNINFVNVDVSSNDTYHWDTVHGDYVGGVIANAGGNTYVENVHVSGDVYVVGCGYVGGIVGHGYPKMTDCSVTAEEGSYVQANYWCAGGAVGYAGEGTTLTNVTVSGLDVWGAYGAAAAVVGLANDKGSQVCKLTNVHASNVNVTGDDLYSGYVAGNGSTAVLNNVTATNVTLGSNIVPTDAVATVGDAVFFDLQDAINAATNGDIVTILADGTYKLPGFSKNLTIKAAKDAEVTIDNGGAVALNGAKVTFENLTFDYYPNVDYTGLQHVDTVVYNNCTFNGQVFLYGASETFNGCTFNQSSPDAYNVWTYGADQVAFNECTFNCAGKSVLVYNEGDGATDVTVSDCEFIASQAVEGKAAIEIDTSLMPDITDIVITKSTAEGFATGSISGETLWNDKKDLTNLTVTVDGEKVWPKTYVAQIGDEKYESLDEALDTAKAAGMTEVEVTLLADCKFSTKVSNFTKVTFTGTNREQTIDLNLNAAFDANVELVFNDLTVSRLDAGWLYNYFYVRGGLTYNDCKMIGLFNVTAQDTDFIGCNFYNDDSFGDGKYSLWVYNSFTGVEVNVTDCTFDVYERAIKMYGDGYTGSMVLNISGTEFTSRTADKTVVEIAQDQNCSAGKFALNVNDSTYTGFGTYEHEGNDKEPTLFNVEVGTNVPSVGGDVKVFKDTVRLWPLLNEDIVAWNVQTGEEYESVQAALLAAKNGETVQLLADADESAAVLTVLNGITLDLNGHTLSAYYVMTATVGSYVIDSTDGKGLLKVAKDNLVLADNSQVMVWKEEESGYRFATVTYGTQVQITGEGSARFNFYVKELDGIVLAELADGIEDNDGLSIQVKMTYTNNMGKSSEVYFDFPMDEVQKYAANLPGYLFMGISGLDTVTDVTFAAVVKSGNVRIESTPIPYEG